MISEVTSLDEIPKGKNGEKEKSMPWDIPMLRGWGGEKENSKGDKGIVAQ